jgi:4-hydroxy-3-methylbut-2-enyl diphosphate reductase IspH
MSSPSKVLLAAPRGYCAGVDRAVQAVEHALDLHGKPVYVRKEIVHNKHVVHELEKRGAIFVEEETEVPQGEMVVFSAHGVAPSVHANAKQRQLQTIDATCPLVTKVHVEARKFAAEGYTIVLIGHEGHEEVEGTTGEAPERTVLVQTEADIDDLEVEDPDRIAYITQTTCPSTRPARSSPAEGGSSRTRSVEARRHLLRDLQPPGGRQGPGHGVRARSGDRVDQLIELEPVGGGRAGSRRRLLPDR